MTLFPLNPKEHDEQVALFAWARWAEHRHPKLSKLHAIPNGGHRNKATAARLKREGVKPGIPDVCLPVPRKGYHGLYLELKRQKGGKLSPDQIRVIGELREEGYRVDVCRGFEAARAAIEEYLA